MADLGLMPIDDLEPAAITAWAVVHGLALLGQGPLVATSPAVFDDMLEATLNRSVRAVTTATR